MHPRTNWPKDRNNTRAFDDRMTFMVTRNGLALVNWWANTVWTYYSDFYQFDEVSKIKHCNYYSYDTFLIHQFFHKNSFFKKGADVAIQKICLSLCNQIFIEEKYIFHCSGNYHKKYIANYKHFWWSNYVDETKLEIRLIIIPKILCFLLTTSLLFHFQKISTMHAPFFTNTHFIAN